MVLFADKEDKSMTVIEFSGGLGHNKYNSNMNDVTLILDALSRGESQAVEDLLPLVYKELRNLATARMLQESAGHTLQPTALVHEAWLRLVGSGNQNWKSRAYFFAAAAEAMRRILVEHARRKARWKHGGGQERLDIQNLELATAARDEKILLVDEALEHLERSNPERARVVVLKFFGGMTNKEVADSLSIGERSVDRHWMCAKAWLFHELQDAD
jgi:RNA polymerase sigma factor (TIGR02999 family)